MKRIIIWVLSILSLNLRAAEPSNTWYECEEGKFNCRKIKIGIFRARITLKDSTRKQITLKSLKSYSIDGRVFERIMLVRNGKTSKKYAFMELLYSYGNLKIYRTKDEETSLRVPFSNKHYYNFIPRVK